MITIDQASEMGAKGAEPTETERLLFEAWMRGHCWLVQGDWDGKSYVHESENTGYLHPGAMLTRQLWAAWRDRAALAEQPAKDEFKAAYIEAMVASNEAGFAGMSAAETIRELSRMVAEQPAQPQEPVARIEITRCKFTGELESWTFAERPRNAPAGAYYVYTSPPAQSTWVGLTDEEVADIISLNYPGYFDIAQAIEAKLKEKNT